MRAIFLTAVTVLFSTVLLSPRLALARPEFPDNLQEATKAPCVPQCTICHQSVSGGGPADQPFAKSLLQFGEVEGKDGMLWTVDQLKQAGVDSDGDGVGDIDEISRGEDPNYAGDALICLPDVGCGARVARETPGSGVDAGLALAVALGLVFARRRLLSRPRAFGP